MKLNKLFISAGVLAAAMSMGSCTGDLDLTPTNPNEITDVVLSKDPTQSMQELIAGVYMNIGTYGPNGNNILSSMDGGMSTFQRAVFNLEEIPTDEANWLPSGDAIDPMFQYGVIPANNSVVMGSYSRLMAIVTLCNQFMQTNFGIKTEQEQALFDEFSRQARILRAGMYFYLIDNFGNVPYADESVTVGSVAPQLSSNFAEGRRLVFERVVADLEDVVAWYKQNDPNNKPPYGYVGLDVAESLLVKYYLNAGVYTGTERWKECYDHAEAVINRLGHGGFQNSGLCKGYHQNFAYNNKNYAIGGAGDVHEIIWTIPQENPTLSPDGVGLTSYANGGFMCNAWIGDAAPDEINGIFDIDGNKYKYNVFQKQYNSANGWKCMSARRQFVEVFDWNEDYTSSPDIRTKMWKTAADGFNINNGSFTQASWGDNGFLAVKYSNWVVNDNNQIDEAASPAPVDPLGIDYAMIRLAEIYLSGAEAALNNGGDKAKALQWVNLIRERAGMEPYASINLPELQNERQRELYTECIRRSDLIRYGKWISGYTWNWKYNVANGTDYPANFIVYPLPTTVVERNGYTQNPGY